MRVLVAVALLGLAGQALGAEPTSIWTGAGSAWTIGQGRFGFGVFGPAVWGVGPTTELRASGLFTLVAPHLQVKQQLTTHDRRGLAVYANLGVPTWGLRLLQGTLLPSDAHIPFAAQGGVGVVGSVRNARWVVSLDLGGRAALPADEVTLAPLDLPFFDPMMAPLLEGPVGTARLVVDYLPDDFVLVTGAARVQVGESGVDLDGRLQALYRIGGHVAVLGGVAVAWEQFTDRRRLNFGPMADLRFHW